MNKKAWKTTWGSPEEALDDLITEQYRKFKALQLIRTHITWEKFNGDERDILAEFFSTMEP